MKQDQSWQGQGWNSYSQNRPNTKYQIYSVFEIDQIPNTKYIWFLRNVGILNTEFGLYFSTNLNSIQIVQDFWRSSDEDVNCGEVVKAISDDDQIKSKKEKIEDHRVFNKGTIPGICDFQTKPNIEWRISVAYRQFSLAFQGSIVLEIFFKYKDFVLEKLSSLGWVEI